MNQQVAVAKPAGAVEVICKAIDAMESGLAEQLKGTGIQASRFLATAKTAVQTHADKDKLFSADRQSLYLAIKRAAGDGLMPDGREAALVVYNTKKKDANGAEKWVSEVQYQPMVQGMVKLARKSGEIEDLGAFVVYDGDKFTYRAGIDAIPTHEADWFGKRGEPIGVWAYVKLKSGDYIQPVMLTKERIDRIALRSKMAGNYNPKTGKDWEEFWKKAAIRNILKYAPRSTVIDKALDDDDAEFDLKNENVYTAPATPSVDAETGEVRETRAASAIKAKAKERAASSGVEQEPQGEIIEADYSESSPLDDHEDDYDHNEGPAM